MTRVELNTLIDRLISIKDSLRDNLSLFEIATLNEACNLIENNMDVLADTKEK